MTETIVVLDPITPITAERLRGLLPTGMRLTHGSARDEAHLQSIIAEADYAISGQIAVPGPVLRAGKRLKLLHKWGVGVDNLDLDTARELGIKVARTTGSNAVPVAEFTIGLMIAAMRHLAHGAAELQRGHWTGGNFARPSMQLSGKTVGIIGFGAIGQALARLLQGFGCTILYNKRHRLDPAAESALNARHCSIPELLAQSDVVSLHCPLTQETAGLIDRAALCSMKRTSVLINVARGGIVIEQDLIWALQNRVIQAAAMDVFDTEPLPADSPLIGVEGLILTPHIASHAADNFDPTVRHMFGNIERVSRGEPIPERDVVVA
ncbi:MAG TPA: 2-hydroxyacid dehydrogenase [Acetobacteraceae bacterium]|nr:2-hydroxyacid dehydrogenase [Acetobacteraceae bacterium]